MEKRTLHATFAYAALVFISWPCFRPFEASLSYGDLFLLISAVLNFHNGLKLKTYQLFLLASVPTLLASQVFDPDGSPEAIIQAAYIFGFVLPFGWIAFAGLPVHRVVSVFLFGQGISATIALGQTFGYLDAFGRARVWSTLDSYRAAGFNTSCSSLCMSLTSLFCALLYVRDHRHRVAFMWLIIIGIGATLAKSSIFAIPALVFYLYWEPNRWRLIWRATLVFGIALGAFTVVPELQSKLSSVFESFSRRADTVDNSLWERLSTIRFALEYVPECYLFGLGYEGTARTLTQHLGNTVHVFHIGLVLIGGMFGAVLHYIGMGLMLREALHHKQYPLIMMVLVHWLAVCTMPVLMLTHQYTTFILAGCILHALTEQAEQQQLAATARTAKKRALDKAARKSNHLPSPISDGLSGPVAAH